MTNQILLTFIILTALNKEQVSLFSKMCDSLLSTKKTEQILARTNIFRCLIYLEAN